MSEFVIVNGNEWAGLYVDGRLVDEGHGISEYVLVGHLAEHGVRIRRESLSADADNEMCEHGSGMPTDLSDVALD